jgi:hypothetical protein
VTCPGAAATFFSPTAGQGGGPYAEVNFDPSGFPAGLSTITSQKPPCSDPHWQAAGFSTGLARINPVQIVRWDMVPANQITALSGGTAYNYGATAVADPLEYVFSRQFIDANGVADKTTFEVIGEYAADLKFAFTVDTSAPVVDTGIPGSPAPGTYPIGATPLQYLALDDPSGSNGNWGAIVNANPTIGPQRIRAVRVRMSTRTSIPDRTLNITPLNPVPVTGPGIGLYRYCASPPCSGPTFSQNATAPTWARVRSVVTEVALPNQARLYY